MKNFKLTYSPITPTHIGSGHTYEPFEYVIQENTFYHLNIDNLLADLTNDEKQKFYKLCNGGSIVDIRNLIAKQFKSNPEICRPLSHMFILHGIPKEEITVKISEYQERGNNPFKNFLKNVAYTSTKHLKNIWKECKVCPLCGKEQHE